MSRKMMVASVFFLAVLLTTVLAWSSIAGHISPADSAKSFTTDLSTAAAYTFKTEIILASGPNGPNGDGDCDGPNGPNGPNGPGGPNGPDGAGI